MKVLFRTHHDDRRHKHQVHEEVAWLRESRCRGLQARSVGEDEVRIQRHAELWSCDEEAGGYAPYLRYLSDCEDGVGVEDKPVEVRYADEMAWDRDEHDGGC